MPKVKRNNWRKYGKLAYRIGTKLANGYAMYNSMTGTTTQNKKKATIRQGVTGHHDSKNIYYRRRMPRRRRRRWQKFAKKVNYIINKQIAPCSLVRTVCITRHAAAINTQLLGVASIYSGYGSNFDLSDDQITILKDAALRAYGDSSKFYQAQVKVTSAVLDITFENITDAADVVTSPSWYNSTKTDAEIDVYELQCVRDVMIQDATQNNRDIYDFITNCCNEQPRPTSGDTSAGAVIGSVLDSTTLGWTPFQSSKFCKYFKILRKTKKYCTPGGYFTYQIRVPADKIIKGNQIDVATDGGTSSSTVFPLFNKHSRLLLFVCKGEPLTNVSDVSYWARPNFTMGMTKTFNYRIVDKAMTTGYVN